MSKTTETKTRTVGRFRMRHDHDFIDVRTDRGVWLFSRVEKGLDIWLTSWGDPCLTIEENTRWMRTHLRGQKLAVWYVRQLDLTLPEEEKLTEEEMDFLLQGITTSFPAEEEQDPPEDVKDIRIRELEEELKKVKEELYITKEELYFTEVFTREAIRDDVAALSSRVSNMYDSLTGVTLNLGSISQWLNKLGELATDNGEENS